LNFISLTDTLLTGLAPVPILDGINGALGQLKIPQKHKHSACLPFFCVCIYETLAYFMSALHYAITNSATASSSSHDGDERELFSLSRQRSPATPACWIRGTKAPATAAGRVSPAASNTGGGLEGGKPEPQFPGARRHHLPCHWQPHLPALTRPELQQPSRRDPCQHRLPQAPPSPSPGPKHAGVIPCNISRCISLREIIIQNNKGLQGSIPAEIGNLPALSFVGLDNNNISGTIPSSLGNLSRSVVLSLSDNYLEGLIPAGIGNNPYLGFLQLFDNDLSGVLPPSLYNLSSLYYFYAALNKFHGRLPSDLGNSLTSIQQLGIGGNRFTGALPLSLTNLSRLQLLDLGNNNFTGVVPAELGRLQQLEVFALD
jgi:hypothetical protein